MVLLDDTIVEFTNLCDQADDGIFFDANELLPYVDRLAATWHTHPTSSANLSVEDSETFQLWPTLRHAIVGTDGVRWYAVKNRAVVNA